MNHATLQSWLTHRLMPQNMTRVLRVKLTIHMCFVCLLGALCCSFKDKYIVETCDNLLLCRVDFD